MPTSFPVSFAIGLLLGATPQQAPEAGPPPPADRPSTQDEASISGLFAICDLDGTRWISFREAQAVLGLEKTEFRHHDLDADGRIDPDEFHKRAEALLERLGVLPGSPSDEAASPHTVDPSVPAEAPLSEAPSAPGTRSSEGRLEQGLGNASLKNGLLPEQILDLYDQNESSGLERIEIERCLRHLALGLSADVLVRQLDHNQTQELELSELAPLSRLVARRLPPAAADRRFEASPPGPGSAATPLVFRRLDSDGDLWIEPEDLGKLLQPAHLDVQLSTVLAALDRDGDGKVDPGEFISSLTHE